MIATREYTGKVKVPNNVTLDSVLLFAESLNFSRKEALYFFEKNTMLDYPIFYCSKGTIAVMLFEFIPRKILEAYLDYLDVPHCTIHIDSLIFNDDE